VKAEDVESRAWNDFHSAVTSTGKSIGNRNRDDLICARRASRQDARRDFDGSLWIVEPESRGVNRWQRQKRKK